MDLTQPVTYRGVQLNTATPTVGKPGLTGIIIDHANVSHVDHTNAMEKRRLADGMDAIETYAALHVVSLRGTVYGLTRGQCYDQLQTLKRVFNPITALHESPSTKGFLPFAYVEPTTTLYPTAKTLSCRPQGLRYNLTHLTAGTNAKVAGKADYVALAVRWTADLVVNNDSGFVCDEDEWPWPPETERPILFTPIQAAIHYPADIGSWTGTNPYDIWYGSTGDAPQSGYPLIPKVGPLEYVYWETGPHVGDLKGIRCLTRGTVHATWNNTSIQAFAGGIKHLVNTARLKAGSVTVADDVHEAYFEWGNYVPSYHLDETFSVSAGDVVLVEQHVTVDGTYVIAQSPAGTGNISFRLQIDGELEVV